VITGVDKELAKAAAIEYASADNADELPRARRHRARAGSQDRHVYRQPGDAMTGNIGRPGVGVNPLRGQNNVQGSADMGLPAAPGRGLSLKVNDPEMHRLYEQFYGRKFLGRSG